MGEFNEESAKADANIAEDDLKKNNSDNSDDTSALPDQEAEPQNIFMNYDPEQFQKRKWNSKTAGENAEYHNCIFVNGEDLEHFIINSGSIDGNISQGNTNTAEASEHFHFQKSEDLKQFFKMYSGTDYLPIFIVLVALKVVPSAHLFSLAQKLGEYIYPAKPLDEGKNITGKSLSTLLSLEEILETMGAEGITVTVKSEAGELTVPSVSLKNHFRFSELEMSIWNGYPGLRDGIIKWLLDISGLKVVRRLILCQIADAVAVFAAMDFSYAKDNIIPRFTRGEHRDDFYFLKRVIGRCLESNECRENTEILLSHWCGLDNNDFLWKTALALYASDGRYTFYPAVYKRLRQTIQTELQQGIAIQAEQTIYLFKEETKIPFNILQENEHVADAYLEILSKQFEDCHAKWTQLKFGYYFMTLLWQDYMTEGYPSYKSIFIDSVNRSRVSKAMYPLIRYAWKKQIFRRYFIEPVFAMYIEELEKYHRSWDYMKKFLKVIAFTGQEADYMHTLKMLKRLDSSRENTFISRQMQDYLQELLSKRK